MAKCFPQQFIHGMMGGSIQNWMFTVPRRGLKDQQCSCIITNETLVDQDIDADDGRTYMDIRIPGRIRNVSVQLTDINYRISHINLIREKSGKLYFFTTSGASQIIRG